MGYKNEKLYQCVKAYILAAIDVVFKSKDKRLSSDLLVSTSSFGFIFSHNKIKQLPQYKNCLEEIKTDKIISSQLNTTIGTHSRSHRLETDQLMLALVRHLAIFENDVKFNEQHFRKGYAEFENTFYDDNFCYEAIVPIIGCLFESSFDIKKGVEIRLINRGDFTFSDENEIRGNQQWAMRISYNLLKIVGEYKGDKYKESKKDDSQRKEANQTANQIIICLRLLGFSHVYPQMIFHRANTWLLPNPPLYPIKYLPEFLYTHPEKVSARHLMEIWKMFHKKSVRENTLITLATKRFSYAHERYEWEDRIIDLMIAAEVLFLGENEQRDKNSFINQKTAELLGTDSQSEETISREMDLAYKLRNNIMHGNKKGLESTIKDIEELDSSENDAHFKREMFTFRIQEYMRCSILRKLYTAL